MQTAPPVAAVAGGSGLAALLLHPGELGRSGEANSLGMSMKEPACLLGLNDFPVPARAVGHEGASDDLFSKRR
eukprot:7399520-Pyramimonas_sp.AAC.1